LYLSPHLVSFAISLQRLHAVLISSLAIANIGWKFYIIFAVLNLSWIPFIWYFYVETAGLSLEEVDQVFKIKYNGGKNMTYKQATVLAREQTLVARTSYNAVDEKAQISQSENEV